MSRSKCKASNSTFFIHSKYIYFISTEALILNLRGVFVCFGAIFAPLISDPAQIVIYLISLPCYACLNMFCILECFVF